MPFKKFFLKIMGPFVLGMLSVPGFADETTPGLYSYKAVYHLSWHGLSVGENVHHFQKLDAQHFLAESVARPFLSFLPFSAFEKSEFFLKNNRIHPLRYQFQKREKNKYTAGTIRFDWLQKKIEYKENQEPLRKISLQNGIQDKISLYFKIRQDLAAGKKHFNYNVMEQDGIKNYTFFVNNETMLQTPLGLLKTVQIEHFSSGGRCTTFWLAKDYDYLMVKWTQVRKGKNTAEGIIHSYQTKNRLRCLQ